MQIARAAELAGFDGLWIPESPEGEAALIVAGSVARETSRLELVIAVRAALQSAVYATKIAVSFQRLTSGRLAWNFVTEADHDPAPWHGRRWATAEHVARTAEFLDVAKGFWNHAPFTYKGEYYEVVDGGFEPALQGQVLPRVYLSGPATAALRISAEKADVHVLPLAPLAQVRHQIAELEALARPLGRNLRYALEADLLVRHTRDEARRELSRQGGSANTSSDSLMGTGFGGRGAQPFWAWWGATPRPPTLSHSMHGPESRPSFWEPIPTSKRRSSWGSTSPPCSARQSPTYRKRPCSRMIQFHWRIPIHGCKGDLAKTAYTRGTWGPLRAGNLTPGIVDGKPDGVPYHDYLLEVARGCRNLGFDGALIPSFPDSEDPWVIASSISRRTKTLRFMVAYQPMWFDPLYAAKAAASLQRLSGGRLLFNIITGGGGPQQLWWGDRIAHDDRYLRTTEFLDVFKGVWQGGEFSYKGKFYQVEGARLPTPLTGQVFPSCTS